MSDQRRGAVAVERDQQASRFNAILARLCEATGALAAALVDSDGETVDYAGNVSPFQVKIAAAEWQIVLRLARESQVRWWASAQYLCFRGARRSFVAVALDEGYVIVVVAPRHSLTLSWRALCEAVRDASSEAGLRVPPAFRSEKERWKRVEVRTAENDPRRPESLWRDGAWAALTILGHYQKGGALSEVGFRARLASGAEITLVREPLGRWYADDVP
jgi:hypothetical protein